MGQATIISESGDGLYTVQPVIDTGFATAQIETLEAQNAAIATRLTEIEIEIETAEDNVASLLTSLQETIAEGGEGTTEQAAYLQASLELNNLEEVQSYLTLRQTANSKRISWLTEQMSAPDEVAVWCADLTEGASGTVGTVELGRLPDTLIIKPGAPTYVSADDGVLQPVALNSAAATFYNLAMLPGVAKWKPRYRTGVASNVDAAADTMDVTLDALKIASQDCNQGTVLTGVPVEYMTCNASAFSDGSEVLIEFEGQDWSAPKVVGFVHDPQPCEQTSIWIKLEINGHVCSLGGEQISLSFTDINGDAVTSSIQSIPEVGAPLDVDSGITVPAANLSLAGPFDLADWDQVSDITVTLYAALSDANRQTTLTDAPYDDGSYKAAKRDSLFTYFYEDSASDNRMIAVEYGWWDKVGSQIGDASNVVCGGALGQHYVSGVSGDEWAVGYTSDWAQTYGDGRMARYKVLAAISRHESITIKTLSAATVLAAFDTSATTIRPMKMESGSYVSGQPWVEVDCDETLQLLNATYPKKYDYGHSVKRTWIVNVPADDINQFDPNYYSFTDPADNPPVSLVMFNSEDNVDTHTNGMTYNATLDAAQTSGGSGSIRTGFDSMDHPLGPGALFNVTLGIVSVGSSGATGELVGSSFLSSGVLQPLDTEPVQLSVGDNTFACVLPSQVTSNGVADEFTFAGQDLYINISIAGTVAVESLSISLVEGSVIETGIPGICLYTKGQIVTTSQSWTDAEVIAATKNGGFSEYVQPPAWAYWADGRIDRRLGFDDGFGTYLNSWPSTDKAPCDSTSLFTSLPLILADDTGTVSAGGGSYSVVENHPEVNWTISDSATSKTFTVPQKSETVTQSLTLITAPEGWF
jgi:hypothetical protein